MSKKLDYGAARRRKVYTPLTDVEIDEINYRRRKAAKKFAERIASRRCPPRSKYGPAKSVAMDKLQIVAEILGVPVSPNAALIRRL